MNVKRRLRSLLGSPSSAPSVADAETEPSHVCPTCGREYFTRPDADIRACRDCGGNKVTQV